MSYPEATSTGNHGLAFQGFGPDPGQNGLFAIGETGFMPKIGASPAAWKIRLRRILLRFHKRVVAGQGELNSRGKDNQSHEARERVLLESAAARFAAEPRDEHHRQPGNPGRHGNGDQRRDRQYS